jgi:hypothetical protein
VSTPDLSAIVLAPDAFDAVRTTVRHLAAQAIADRIEVVLVTTSRAKLGLDEGALASFAGHHVVETGGFASGAAGYAAGVRAARAPIVIFCEDHCYPAAGWAQALLRAHANGFAAVGPVVAHANTDGAIAWSDFLLGYGPWLAPSTARELEYLPGHNSSYKREALLAYDPGLERWLEAESVLHWDLRSRGERLYLEGAACTHHFSFSRARSWIAATFFSARTFGARRVRREPWWKRPLYIAGTPLVPLIRARRCVRDYRRVEPRPSLVRLLPALSLALSVSAAGEAVGYAFGPGNAPCKVSAYEFHRDRHVNARDRQAMAEARFFE